MVELSVPGKKLWPKWDITLPIHLEDVLVHRKERRIGVAAQQREFIVTLCSATVLVASVIFAVEPWKGFAVTGIVLSLIGASLVSHSMALLVSLLRSRLRSKFACRVFGVVQTLQCVATLVLLPPNEHHLASRA
ncbi:hypothetical protein DL770_010810 [Monosporascus sp. CRB-9-2]|nr:hypothetical protein DL770_010810 [Monosporascus sp. CRB-9-2]